MDHEGDGFPTVYEFIHGSAWSDRRSTPTPTIFVVPSAFAGGDGSAEKPFADMQTAFAAAQPFDIVQLAPGVYKGPANKALSLTSQKILVYSEKGPTDTIVDCENSGSFATLSRCSTSMVIRGLRIINASQYHYYISEGAPQIVDCLFSGLTLSTSYALITCSNSSPTIKNCVFSDNTSTSSSTSMISFSSSSPLLANCVFSNNMISPYRFALEFSNSNARIVSCTFHRNGKMSMPYSYYGAVLSANGGNVTVHNSILWDLAGTELYGSATVVDSCVKGGYAGTGNFDAEPKLTRGGRLTPLSPCVDAGNPTTATSFDMDGELRPSGAKPDIGADEFIDSDGDDMADAWELAYFGDLSHGPGEDPDKDSVDNLREYLSSTNPNDCRDIDGDGMSDDWEIQFGLAPRNAADASGDPDGDQLTNLQEFKAGTNPTVADTDGDSFIDGEEVESRSDPSDPYSFPGQFIVVGPSPLYVPEGGGASCQLSLSVKPCVTEALSLRIVQPQGGGFQLEATSPFTYGLTDWSQPQAVRVVKAAGTSTAAGFAELVVESRYYGVVTVPLIERKNTSVLHFVAGPGGSTTPCGDVTVARGETVTVTAFPQVGCEFDCWSGDVTQGNERVNPLTIVADAPKTLFAAFRRTSLFRARFEIDGATSVWTSVALPLEGDWRLAPTLHAGAGGEGAYFDDVSVAAGAQAARAYGFEAELSGAVPSGWSARPLDYHAVVSDDRCMTGGKALRLPPASDQDAGITLQTAVTPGDGVFSFALWLDSPSCPGRVAAAWFLGVPLDFVSEKDGTIAAFTYDPSTPSCARRVFSGIQPGRWINVAIHVDMYVDVDNDGMDDEWELLMFGDLSQTALEDYDGDGWTNRDEYAGGTNPRLPDPTVGFFAAFSTVTTSAGTVALPVSLSYAAAAPVRVSVEVTAGTAKNGKDFHLVMPCAVTFSPGETLKHVTVGIVNNGPSGAPDKTVALSLVNPLGAAAAFPSTYALTITERGVGDDSDGDGLPDWWEIKYFGDLRFGAGDDPDSDGYVNLVEYKRGMNPNAGVKRDNSNTLKLRLDIPAP